MDYRLQLIKEHSRNNTDAIAKTIGKNDVELKKIIDIIYNEPAPLPQRAAWVLSIVNGANPHLLKPYLNLLATTIKDFKRDGIKRNFMSILSYHKIPKELQGELITTCFDFILSPTETVAVKTFSLQVLANIAKEEPELINEIKLVIEDQLPKTTAAFHSRAKKILKNLK